MRRNLTAEDTFSLKLLGFQGSGETLLKSLNRFINYLSLCLPLFRIFTVRNDDGRWDREGVTKSNWCILEGLLLDKSPSNFVSPASRICRETQRFRFAGDGLIPWKRFLADFMAIFSEGILTGHSIEGKATAFIIFSLPVS